MKRYNPKEVEPKWQKIWDETGIYKAVDFDKRPKYIMLTEFPYPSGDGLHLGHVREYTLGDILARRKRMSGYNVLYPMGYDAFGLPTENFAIKNKIAPQTATDQNTANFQAQFNSLGYSIDWSRSFKTSDPDYYKWTQWLFLQFFKTGLAYQDESAINWCPKCKTGLSNEEVLNGQHERCGTLVEKKLLKQWILKITEYADRLIEGLKTVDYPSRIADQQINWIGRSVGAEIDFTISGKDNLITVFTTRADTLFGATYMVLAPEHALVNDITSSAQRTAVTEYVKASQAKSEIDRMDTERPKTGVFTGAYANNPATGKKIPIWIADYVLAGYGTGAIMAVPAHDLRDNEFARKFDLPIVEVVEGAKSANSIFIGEGSLINSGEFTGLISSEAREKITEKFGREKVQYRLRDWIFSRQHYWGEPIPIIHCSEHGAVPVSEKDLPVILPKVEHYEPTDSGESPLAAIDSWVNTVCPMCGKPARRETDTMPNWAGSSWYYLRYFDAHNDAEFANRDKLDYWGKVDMYLGGMEHTTLHLLYSRFWHQFLYDQGLVPTDEPYAARRGQGIILAPDGTKMSKSKGNVINPSDIIEQGYGADSIRLAIAFLAPYDQTTPWNSKSVPGTYRYLNRLWNLVQEFNFAHGAGSGDEDLDLLRITHQAIKKVSTDLQSMSFNTAIAALMEAVNGFYLHKAVKGYESRDWQFALSSLVQLTAPFAPHITEELWHDLGNNTSIHISEWPVHNEKYLLTNEITVVVQVNGKVRANIKVATDSDKDTIIAAAKADENVAPYVQNGITTTIYVPSRLVNFVV